MKISIFNFRRLLVLLFLSLTFVIPAFSQAGSNDPTFNSADQGLGFGDGANGTIITMAIQSDGKIIVGGGFTMYNGTATKGIARLNTDGSLDAGFNPGTGVNGSLETIAIQSDGKIIVAGFFFSYNGTTRNHIARLNSDGSLDASFDPGSGPNSTIYTTAIQSDGKIIIGGAFTMYNGTARDHIARLNIDGGLDGGYSPVTGASTVYTTAIQSDGKIIIGGFVKIARLNTNGSVDASFNVGTGANNINYTTAIQSDGMIVIGGQFTSYNGTARSKIARLNTNGSLDAGFNPGTGADNTIRSTVIQSDGKIIIGGLFTFYNGIAINRIARLNSDGSLDAGFNTGRGANNTIISTVIQNDGKIIISGTLTAYNGTARNYIVRLNTNSSVDEGHNPGTGANNIIHTTVIQSDGKIIIGGDFTGYNGIASSKIARLNTDGTPDAGFNPVAGANSTIRTSTIQSNGKIIIGGDFTSYNGTARSRIARLNTDGSLDAGFIPGTGANNSIYTSANQSDGKIIIGGDFTTYNGTARSRIARLNTDGSLDAGFTPGTGANSSIRTISIQSDGKIIIGGAFNFYNGAVTNYIARLNSDGSLDAGFNIGSGTSNWVQTTAIQSDGKIIIGGLFGAYNGTPINYIARLNTNGSLDAGFTPGTGANNYIQTSAIQSDGKIIIGGLFTSYNETATNYIARLNSNGSFDAGFNTGTGANNTIRTTAIQSDGKIIIGGDFTSYNGTGRNRAARVMVGVTVPSTSPTDYFRTIASGNWNSPATWESSPVANFSSGVVNPATLAPDFQANTITIRGSHSINVTANVIAAKTTIAPDGKLTVITGVTLTVK